ncbi:MAG: hypothetical protein R2860_14225 [Desulfobacterales bacterium]
MAVGGSYIAWHGSDCFNTLCWPPAGRHNLLSQQGSPHHVGNRYYTGGSDDGILDTPSGKVGVALCWEFVRSMTARRLAGRVDFKVGGLRWWTLPEKMAARFPWRLHRRQSCHHETNHSRFARMLGVPVVHAAHAGDFLNAPRRWCWGFRTGPITWGKPRLWTARVNNWPAWAGKTGRVRHGNAGSFPEILRSGKFRTVSDTGFTAAV